MQMAGAYGQFAPTMTPFHTPEILQQMLATQQMMAPPAQFGNPFAPYMPPSVNPMGFPMWQNTAFQQQHPPQMAVRSQAVVAASNTGQLGGPAVLSAAASSSTQVREMRLCNNITCAEKITSTLQVQAQGGGMLQPNPSPKKKVPETATSKAEEATFLAPAPRTKRGAQGVKSVSTNVCFPVVCSFLSSVYLCSRQLVRGSRRASGKLPGQKRRTSKRFVNFQLLRKSVPDTKFAFPDYITGPDFFPSVKSYRI